MPRHLLIQLVWIAGAAQLLLSAGSIAIPVLLKWKDELSKVSTLIKNIFVTYAVYILAINVWFGIISVAFPEALSDRSPLSCSVSIFIMLYWWGRVGIQFIFSKAEGRPAGALFIAGEILLWGLFIFLAIVYTLLTAYNLMWF